MLKYIYLHLQDILEKIIKNLLEDQINALYVIMVNT